MIAWGTITKLASYSTKQMCCYCHCYNIQQCIYNIIYLYAVPGCSVNTLHFWAGLKDSRYSNDQLVHLLECDPSFKSAAKRICETDVLVIDEISMISSKVFQQLEHVCRKMRKCDHVFGGLQLIVSGDFKQLKPVPNNAYKDPGDYCFHSKAWKTAITHIAVLNETMRQEEPQLISAINNLSDGVIPDETTNFIKTLSRQLPPQVQPIYLYAHNYDVDMTCYDFLEKLPGQEKVYRSEDCGNRKLLSNSPVPKNLVLKVGCKVMLVTNLSSKLVNGLIGEVKEMNDGSCMVKFENTGLVTITPQTFSVYSQEECKDVACRKQLPLKLAYAITIHKAQGMTLDNVVIDARHANNPGQLATAVGRVRNSSGIQVLNFQKETIPKQPPDVITFLHTLQNQTLMMDDFICCRNAHQPQIIEEYPLGEEPLMFYPDQDVMEGDLEEPWNVDEIIEDLLQDNDHAPNEDIPLPNELNVEEITNSVRTSFIPSENQAQQDLANCDLALNRELLSKYLGRLWNVLLSSSTKLNHKTSLKNKDITQVISSFDKYSISAEHNRDLEKLFGHRPNPVEQQLAFKYRHKLLHSFWTEQAKKSKKTVDQTSDETSPSDVARAGIRYLAGMSVAKARYKHRHLALSNIHKKSERDKVHDHRIQEKMLERLTVAQHVIEDTTKDTPSLQLIRNKQNMRLSLTHVTDRAFQFFMLLDAELSKMLKDADVQLYKGDVLKVANEKILNSNVIFEAWKSLFLPTEMPSQFMRSFMMCTIEPYIHVKWNQLRKDIIDAGREGKTLEIRKEIWNRENAGTKHRRSVQSESQQPVNKQTRPSSSSLPTLSELQKICMSGDFSTLTTFSKKQLQQWCQMYGVPFKKSTTKATLAERLQHEVITCSSAGETSSVSSTNMPGSDRNTNYSDGDDISEYICPKCNVVYLNNDMWVGCDNENCELFICRKCANLTDSVVYQQAIKRYWKCPFC